MYSVNISDYDDWREQARELLKRRIPPESINWQTGEQTSLFGSTEFHSLSATEVVKPEPKISSDFFDFAKFVACHRDTTRWQLLYCVAWRLVFVEKNLLKNKIDPQVSKLLKMYKSVNRDKHKMKAFVRFKNISCQETLEESTAGSSENKHEKFLAWFEPEHFIVALVAPFFVKRFRNMNWSILTPDACVHWTNQNLIFTEGVTKPPKTKDTFDDLWIEYYRNIFNPARLKLKAMQSEMPKKYWINLPEASIIKELASSAGRTTEGMINTPATEAWQKTANSTYVRSKQKRLRSFDDNDFSVKP